MAVPSFTSQQLGTAADWSNPVQSWQRLKAAHGGTLNPEQSAYVDQQIGAGTSAANPFAAGSPGTPGATPAPATTLGGFDVSVPNAPAFTAPQRATPGVAMPTLGTIDPYTGPTSFQVPGVEGMYADPGYQWRRDEALKAADRTAAANGTLRGGAQIRAQMGLAGNMASQEYANVFGRARDTTSINAGLASDAFDRSRFERDARYAAGVGDWNRNVAERNDAYDASFRGAEAEYAPGLQTWAGRAAAGQRNAELQFVNPWDQTQFWADLNQRKGEQDAYAGWRNRSTDLDEAFRRYQSDVDTKRFLASIGNF